MKTILFIIFVIGMIGFTVIPYSYAQCVATIIPEPCFDSFSTSGKLLTEKSIMKDFARNIDLNYGDLEMSDRKWENYMEELEYPIIICTEFVVDGTTEYRMAKWVDAYKISSFEDHRNDKLCDLWLAPIPEPEPIPEPRTYCGAGTVLTSDGCIVTDEPCGENTTYEDGICVDNPPRMIKSLPENQSDTSVKWANPYPNPELAPTSVKIKTIGDDAPFFGIFVYFDNLISWIFGK